MQRTLTKSQKNQYLSGLQEHELVALAESLKWPSFKGKQIHSWIYKKYISSIDEMTDLSVKDRLILNENYKLSPLESVEKQVSKDQTIKYLWKLNDGSL